MSMISQSHPHSFLVAGSILGGLAVAAGAFGAHMLKGIIDAPMLAAFETAVRYQMYHALALCILARVGERQQAAALTLAGWCFVVGIALFSGSLYVMALSGIRWVGPFTPIGGLSMMLGWALLAREAWRARNRGGN